jgi:N-acylglucosamine-6-phosphate 2-epimerase
VTQNYSKVLISQWVRRASLRNVSVSSAQQVSALASVKGGLIVSCQVPDGTAIDTPAFIAAQALTVIQAGAIGIRAQGIANVAAIAKVTDKPILGLVKRYLDTTPFYITPTVQDVLELEAAGATIIAIDATERLRTGGVNLEIFLNQVRAETNIPILADIDTVEAAVIAEALGCEAVATTLSGYTEKSAPPLPNIGLVEKLVKKVNVPVIAEGGFSRPEHVTEAFAAGAWTVCIGTAITNPFLLTKSFLEAID